MNRKNTVLVVALVAIAMVTLPGNAFVNTDNNAAYEKVNIPIKMMGRSMATAGMDGNILVTPDSPEDDILPGITMDGSGNIVVSYTHQINMLSSEIGWGVSTDDGASWQSFITTAGATMTYNDIAWENGPVYHGLFGVYIDPVNEEEGFYTASDATDPSTFTFYHWTSEAPDVSYACISDDVYLEGQYHGVKGPANMYIEHLIYQDYDVPGCPYQMITGFDENGQPTSGEGTFDGQSHLITAPASDPDMSGEHMKAHYVWQYENASAGKSQIVWKKIIPVEGDTDSTDIEFTPYQQYIDFGQHPDISHSGNNVVIVYMTNDNIYGDWDIKCAYSSDDGETWQYSKVTDIHPGNEEYPAVYMSGSNAYCVYIANGNLYLTKSTDGGATWGEPVQINDVDGKVVAEPRSVDITEAGIVWEDTRDGNKDIYYAQLPAPRLEIGLSGGFGLTVHVENNGQEAAKNVNYDIELSGLVFMGKSTTGTIDELAPGTSQDIKVLAIGIGPVTASVTVGGASATAKGFLLGPLLLGLK